MIKLSKASNKTKTYHIPIGNFGSCHMFDSNMFAITITNSSIDGTKTAFAQDLTNSVGPFKRLPSSSLF